MISSILSTKLYIPEMRLNHVTRKALVEKLAGGIDRNCRLTLVSAPAGYGKTTLILELMKFMKLKSAWISLDEGDNDPSRFLSYFIAALKKAGVNIGSDTEGFASEFNPSTIKLLMTMIINDIASLPERIILVLDDFHLIYSLEISDTLKFLIDHQPPNFHIAIITREDPKLPLSRLRARDELNEVRVGDLRFCREETGEFFKNVMGLDISGEDIDIVTSRTEGWIAGLQLAGLSLKGCREGDIDSFIKEFNGTHRYIIDYLVDEVLDHQSREVRDFLCKTSILDRLNGELCDAVAEGAGSGEMLHRLEEDNLFVIPLDDKREWYRYHHLFADSIRTELSREDEMQLNKRAALWMESKGFKQEAVKHAFRSGGIALSVKMVEDTTEQCFRDAQLATLLKWLDELPEELVKKNEILSVRKAWALYITGRARDAMTYLSSLGEDFALNTTPHNRGLILSLKALNSLQAGLGKPEELAEEALKLLEPWDPIARISTLNTLGRAQAGKGQTLKAEKTFRMAYNEGMKIGYAFITTLALMNLGTNLNAMGRRKEVVGLYNSYIDGMTSVFGKPLPYIGVIYLSFAVLYYEGNELQKAQSFITKGLELCSSISYNWGHNGSIWKARIEYAMGDTEGTINTARELVDIAIETNIPRDIVAGIDLLTGLLLRHGDIENAAQYKDILRKWMDDTEGEIYEQVCIAYARILIYQGAFAEALDILGTLEEDIKFRQANRMLITYYILYAAALMLKGEQVGADSIFCKAVDLAGDNGYYRSFLDEGPVIGRVILKRDNVQGEFEIRLLEYFNHGTGVEASQEPADDGKDKNVLHVDNSLDYVEKLSPREVDILKLLGSGLTNNDISKELFISTNTTQWHISHIYSKLGVKNRTQAIIKAKNLGIL